MIWLIIFGLYTGFLSWLVLGMSRTPSPSDLSTKQKIGFSILVPFRNEETRIEGLLQSLVQMDYPKSKFELIFIDDHSTDSSCKLIHHHLQATGIQYRILKNGNGMMSPKKQAITLGVSKASFEWIVTTDADCEVPRMWLTMFATYIEHYKPKMILGPVNYHRAKSFFESFQQLHFISLQATNLGLSGWKLPIMNNGANLAYQAEAFHTCDGYKGNTHIASGDDVFLLEKFKTLYPSDIYYLNDPKAMVYTLAEGTWLGFIRQSVRWAGKSSALKNNLLKWIGLGIFLVNLSVLLVLILALILADYRTVFYICLAIKITADFLFFLRAFRFFAPPKNKLLTVLVSSLLYPFYFVGIAFLVTVVKVRWKDRSYPALTKKTL